MQNRTREFWSLALIGSSVVVYVAFGPQPDELPRLSEWQRIAPFALAPVVASISLLIGKNSSLRRYVSARSARFEWVGTVVTCAALLVPVAVHRTLALPPRDTALIMTIAMCAFVGGVASIAHGSLARRLDTQPPGAA